MAFSQILERHIYIQTCFLSSLFACGRAELLEIHISVVIDVVVFFIFFMLLFRVFFDIFFYFGYTFDYLTVASRYMKNIIIYLND